MTKWGKWIILATVLVALVVFFEWLGSEQEQKAVDVAVELPDKTGQGQQE